MISSSAVRFASGESGEDVFWMSDKRSLKLELVVLMVIQNLYVGSGEADDEFITLVVKMVF